MKKLVCISIFLFASSLVFSQQKKVAKSESPIQNKKSLTSINKFESKEDYFKHMKANNCKNLIDKKYYAINKYN